VAGTAQFMQEPHTRLRLGQEIPNNYLLHNYSPW